MHNQPFSPDELFRQFHRGMLDHNTLISQILLNLIDLAETQKAHGLLLEMITQELDGLAQDIEAIANLLRMRRPSQTDPTDDGDTGSDDENPAASDEDDAE
jgi:hypothetical protein